MLDIDFSIIFWIFFMVWGLYLVLTRIFFKPVGAIIAEREGRVAADNQRLQGMLDQVENRTQSLENQIAQARQEAAQIREEWLAKGEGIRTRSLAEAKEKAALTLGEKMDELAADVAVVEKALEKQIVVFSEKIKQAYL
jgi:F-type H+-transporting ATPase subunit b